MRARWRLAAIGIVLALFTAACATTPTIDQASDPSGTPLPAAQETVEPTATHTPQPTTAPTATTVPEPTAEPTPAPTPTEVPPTPTPTPVDTTPVIIQGDGWATTQADVARLASFVEVTHQLEYSSPVTVLVSDDIAAEYAPDFEAFESGEWWLLQALGLADTQADREITNQVRRDRIRGLCCRYEDGTQVVVEVEATKLETEAILVHELTHALHTQHPELFADTRDLADETPKPFAASTEGVPQFVTFAFLAMASPEELAVVTPELPIIRPDMIPLVGPGPAQHINFAYATGPAFVDAVVEARGIAGLSELLTNPATTTEQILFPAKYLAGELAVPVAEPAAVSGSEPVAIGTIGAAMLMFLLIEEHGQSAALDLVEPWAGDRFVIYESDGNTCMVANIQMDATDAQVGFGTKLADSLRPDFPDVTMVVVDGLIELRTCDASSDGS